MKKFFKYLGLALLVIIFGGSLFLALADPTIPIEIKESEAQSLIDKKLPFNKTVDFKIPLMKQKNADIKIDYVKVDFLENGKIKISSLLVIESEGRLINGEAEAEAKIVYSKGAFYLDDVVINEIYVEKYKITDRDRKLLQSGSNLISKGKSAITAFNKFIKKEDKGGAFENGIPEGKLDEILLKIRKELINKSEKLFIEKLEETPIYKLNGNDYKQNIAKLMLRDVVVSEDSLEITMSVGKLVSTIWLYIISFTAGIVFVVSLARSVISNGGGRSAASVISLIDL